MRVPATIILLACTCWAQFKSTVPLVVAPTTITDAKGRYVDGLTAEDLVFYDNVLYDNNVPQKIQMDWIRYPIDLVVAVQTSSNSGAVLDKLGGAGILLIQGLAADAGETAVVSFSDRTKIHQDFTGDPDLVINALRMLRKEGDDAHMLDGLQQALRMLERRPRERRRIILMIAEKRYWLTFSPLLQPKPEAERIKIGTCAQCPAPDETPVPPDLGPGNPIYAIGELIRLHQPDLSSLFIRTTGGRALNFLKKNALEHAIQLVSEEVHRQYILSFQPMGDQPGKFHAIRVAVQDRPEFQVKTRQGYWALQ